MQAAGGALVRARTHEEMIGHLLAHRSAGHAVPDDALEELRADAAESGQR